MSYRLRIAVYLGVFDNAPAGVVLTSRELCEQTGIHATLIRRDLSGFGWTGKRGVGYDPRRLVELLSPYVVANRGAIVREIRAVRRNYESAVIAIQGRAKVA